MADVQQTLPLTRNVIAHCCAACTCPGVDNPLRRDNSSSSSEASVGNARSGARYRGPSSAVGSAGEAVPPAVNGHVQVDVGAGGSDSGVSVRDRDSDSCLDDDDELCPADVVATNLLELYSGRHPKLKLAFDDWERTFQTFQTRREYKEAQRDAVRNEIYQVIGFYVVFQGVIFTAVAQASFLNCKNWWTSFLLSLLSSLVTIGVVLQKLSDFWALETTIANEKSAAKVLKIRINGVKLSIGPTNFDFKKHAQDGKKPKDLIVPGFKVKIYWFAEITVLLCFSPSVELRIMASTDIINKTGKALRLKVGHNLVFTDLTTVPKDGSYKVHVDPNATYQEYLMGKDRNGRPLIISSDDCADNKSITIVEDKNGNFITEKKSRNSSSTSTSKAGLSPTTSSFSSSRGAGLTNSKSGSSKISKFLNSFRSNS